ncbi:MAG: hypothetical protein MMC33_006753 [Icmadophila ericetorum]|nr:hypothetical protein [Icmadophila ericetorum]
MPIPRDPIAFTDTLADLLRLPDETVAMSYIYRNKYEHYLRSTSTSSPLDPNHVSCPTQTLSLVTLTLSSKATEAPRRLRAILLPAYSLLHPPPQLALAIPSVKYDTFRATVVRAELLLLRVLAFELRIPTPLDYLPRYVERAMEDSLKAAEDYERWGKEEKEELGVIGEMDGGLGRICKIKAAQACKNYQLANLFPARAVAVGCLYLAIEERGLRITEDVKMWLDNITSGKVDVGDFEEVLDELKQTA